MMRTKFLLGISNGPWLIDFERGLIGNCDGEVIRRSDGFLVGRSVKRMSRFPLDRSGVRRGVGWVFGGLGVWQVAQRR